MGTFALDSLVLCQKVKKLTDFASKFSPYDFKKNGNVIVGYFKMNEISKTNLSEQTKFRLSEIIGIKNYLHQEIN